MDKQHLSDISYIATDQYVIQQQPMQGGLQKCQKLNRLLQFMHIPPLTTQMTSRSLQSSQSDKPNGITLCPLSHTIKQTQVKLQELLAPLSPFPPIAFLATAYTLPGVELDAGLLVDEVKRSEGTDSGGHMQIRLANRQVQSLF